MTTAPWTAWKLLTGFRRAGAVLAANGDGLAFDAPAGVMTSEMRAVLTACKRELLAVLRGEYLLAAAELLRRETKPGEWREHLVYLFDERAGICEYDGGMSRGEAERQAYIELARAMEVDQHGGTGPGNCRACGAGGAK